MTKIAIVIVLVAIEESIPVAIDHVASAGGLDAPVGASELRKNPSAMPRVASAISEAMIKLAEQLMTARLRRPRLTATTRM